MELHPLHLRIRQARKDKDLNQSDLASRVGKSTSAICQFEKGDPHALADDVVRELCRFLEVAFEPRKEVMTAIQPDEEDVLAFCRSVKCPMANFDFEDGELIVQPKMYRVRSTSDLNHCSFCKQQLQTGCSGCLTAIAPGAVFCSGCEKPLVPLPPEILGRDDLAKYARQRIARRNRFLSSANDITELSRPAKKNSRFAP